MREFSPSMMLLPLQYTTRQVQLDMRVLLWRGGAGAKTSHVSSLIAEALDHAPDMAAATEMVTNGTLVKAVSLDLPEVAV